MKINKQLYNLAWPIFITNILGIFLGFGDVYVLSRVNDLAASAVGTACQITSVSSLLFSVVCGATGILVAQYLGSNRREDASKITALCITMNLLFGCMITGVVVCFHNTFLIELGARGVLYTLASDYITILGWSIFLDAYQSAVGSILYSHGETKIAMYLSMTMGILNLCLNFVLVLGLFGVPALGIRGAAIGTVITKVIGASLESVVLFTKVEDMTLFGRLSDVTRKDIWGIFRLGVPTIMDSINYSITQLLVTGLILHHLSDTDIIARTYMGSIAVFFQIFTNAVASATQILVGYAAGAEDYELVKRRCNEGLWISLVTTLTLSVTACIFAGPLFGIFTEDVNVIALGRKILIANVAVEIGRVLNVSYIWCLRGVGDVSVPVAICVLCMWIIAVGGSWSVLELTEYGLVGVVVIAGFDEWVRGLLMQRRWKSGHWMKKII